LSRHFPNSCWAHARFKESLGYAFNFEKMSWIERLMVRMLAKAKSSQSHIGMGKIAALAASISEPLQ
jgi:menaquinone-dependent protoporphyrinogen IX oxidase